MFRMHQATCRKVARGLWFALCIVPSVLVAAWAVGWNSSRHTSAVAAQLSRDLGLSVELGDVRHLRPGAYLLSNVKLADPDHRRKLALIRRVEVQSHAGGTRLVLSEPQLFRPGADRLIDNLAGWLARHAGHEGRIDIAPCLVTVQGGGSNASYEVPAARVTHSSSEDRLEIEFRLPGRVKSRPALFALCRLKSKEGVATRLELDTRGTAFSGSFFGFVADVPAWIGPRATIDGRFWAVRKRRGWEGEVIGLELDEIDLSRLVTNHFPHQLDGSGRLALKRATFRESRLASAQGSLRAGPGVMSRSLWQAGIEWLGFVEVDEARDPGRSFRYRELGIGFELDEDRLALTGLCRDADGVALTDSRGEALWLSPREPSPAVALVSALVPRSESWVPATAETQRLLRWLHAPSSLQRDAATDSAPQTNLRSNDRR